MDWLHFIGKGFYPTAGIFEAEAAEYNVSRRINQNMLQRFNFGDRVYLFQKDKKGSILFGYFIVDSVLGDFPDKLIIEIEKEKKVVETIVYKIKIIRKCGDFILVVKRRVKYSIKKIDLKIRIYGCENLMIGGTFFPLHPVKTPIVFQQGFRPFNYEEFQRQKNESKKLTGQFYLLRIPDEPENEDGYLVNISDYKKNKVVRPTKKERTIHPKNRVQV